MSGVLAGLERYVLGEFGDAEGGPVLFVCDRCVKCIRVDSRMVLGMVIAASLLCVDCDHRWVEVTILGHCSMEGCQLGEELVQIDRFVGEL